MVQKVTSYTGNFAMGLNFQPTTINGLNVSHTGGAVAGNGDIVETASGALAIPASVAWSAYIDVTDGILRAVDTASLPTENTLIIWDGTSDANSVTSFRDVRSWTSTATTVAPSPDSFETLIGKLAPDHWWKMNDDASPLADSGTASARTGAEVGPGSVVHYNMPAYTAETRTMTLGGSEGFLLSDTIVPTATTGTVVFLFKGLTSIERSILHLGDQTALHESHFSIRLTGSGGFVIDVKKDLSNHSSYTGGSGFDDGFWHLGVVRQDGTGVTLRVDDVNISLARADTGDAELADWFDYTVPTSAGGTIGNRRLNVDNYESYWLGNISNVAVWDGVVLSNEQILLLQTSLQQGFWSYLNQTLKPEFSYWFGGETGSIVFNMGSLDPLTSNLGLGSSQVFNRRRPGNAGGNDTNAIMTKGQGWFESGPDTGPELGGTTFGTLIYAWKEKPTTDIKLWNEFGPFQSGTGSGAGGHYTTGINGPNAKAIYFADDGFPDSQQNDTRAYDDTDGDNGLFNLAVIVKNDDANPPDYYFNGVLQTVFTDENSTESLETWWDSHINGTEWAFGRDINAGGAYAEGVILEHMVAIEGVVVTAEQALELNTRYVIERGPSNMEDVCLAAGPSHYIPMTESGLPLVDLGFACRESSASTIRANHNIDTEDGAGSITYQVTGPNGADKGVSFSATNVRLYMSTANPMALDGAGPGGAVACFFKTGNTSQQHYLWEAGNTGGAYGHRMHIKADGDMSFLVRNGIGGNEIAWTFTPPSEVRDDNWHFICWRSTGSAWTIRLDGIDYDDGDSEVTESTMAGWSQLEWWGILPTIDQACWGNAANSGFSTGIDGELAHCMIWRENDGTQTVIPSVASLARIEVAGGVV